VKVRSRVVRLMVLVAALSGCDSRDPDTGDAGPGMAAEDVAVSSTLAADVKALAMSADPAHMDWVGQQVFQNECSGKRRCLVHWNEGEDFPSLGIGHFIWYPQGVDRGFVESFPDLVQFMESLKVDLPGWLRELEPFDAPWPDRVAFLGVEDSPEVEELRQFLANTRDIQARYIFQRASVSMERVVAAVPGPERRELVARLQALTATPGGIYALMDYVNFKGEGLAVGERYNGQGWGLLQVLQAMNPSEGAALAQFRVAAAQVLTRRARNADNPMEGERWLPGWLKRLETYREPASVALPSQ